jgi:hypothetical protein
MRRMPSVKDVGEPCAGKSHARFDGRGLEQEPRNRPPRQSPTLPQFITGFHTRIVASTAESKQRRDIDYRAVAAFAHTGQNCPRE